MHNWINYIWQISLACTLLLFGTDRLAADPVNLVPHQATYELTLHGAPKDPSIKDVTGTMVYELSGNECVGFTQSVSMATKLEEQDGNIANSDFTSSTFEDAGASTLRFRSRSVEGSTRNAVEGSAQRSGTSIIASLTVPEPKSVTLNDAMLFPVEHTRRLIEMARMGKSEFAVAMFDGTEGVLTPSKTVTQIGQPVTGAPASNSPDTQVDFGHFNKMQRWPVTTHYSIDAASIEPYSISFELYENGVSRNTVISNDRFSLFGTTKVLVVSEYQPCK